MPDWSYRLGAAAAGLAYAREAAYVLAWDANLWLSLVNRRGQLQGKAKQEAVVAAAAAAEDASAFAVATTQGHVAWLGRDLTPRWKQTLVRRPTALAIDSLGTALAVADEDGRLHLFDAAGLALGPPVPTPRPAAHLAFLPGQAVLVAAGDFGWIAAFDLRGKRWLWQDSPVVHLGDLACSGDGSTVAVACYSEGLRRYDAAGRPRPPLPTPEPARLASATYAGDSYLVGSVFGTVYGLDAEGQVRSNRRMEPAPVGLALAPRGEAAVVALADGRLMGLDLASVGA